MKRSKNTAVTRVALSSEFENKAFIAVDINGIPMWSVRQLGDALGYSPRTLANTIRNRWRAEFTEGVDYVILTGDELKFLRTISPGMVPPRSPSLMMLTESGVHLVSLLSRKAAAKRLRRWLADEVLPAIRATGTYSEVKQLPAAPSKREVLVQGRPCDLTQEVRATIAIAAMAAPITDQVALVEMLTGEGHGSGRYWRKGGVTDAQLRAELVRDVGLLPAAQRDQVARWMGVHLGKTARFK